MKRIFYIIVLALVFGCSSSKKPISNAVEQSKTYFSIVVYQDGKVVPQINNTITLKKEPFKFEVILKGVEEVIVSASWGSFFFDIPENENIFECDLEGNPDECRFMMGKVGAQTKFNTKKQLMVGDRNYLQGWFYIDEIPYHRFDEGVSLLDGKIIGEMTIENIYDLDLRDKRIAGSKHQYKVEEINKDIYMVFATSNYIKEQKVHEETQREKFIIKFE